VAAIEKRHREQVQQSNRDGKHRRKVSKGVSPRVAT
jgi:hypothetical protein